MVMGHKERFTMKRFVLAFLISFVFVGVLSVAILILSPVFGGRIMESPFAKIPLNLPLVVFDALAPEGVQYFFASSPTTTALHKLLLFFGNVLIYMIPIAAIMKLFKKNK